MYCKKCGAQMNEGAKFCTACGTTVGETGQPQPVYQQPAYAPDRSILREPMTVGQFFGMQFLLAIPLVGFILMLVWGFSSDTNLNKKNFCRASLLWMVIGLGLSILLTVLFGAAVWSLIRDIDFV